MSHSKRRNLVHFLSSLVVLLATGTFADATTLTVRILDESGAAVAARVYLSDAQGKNFFPPGTLIYRKLNWGVSEEHFITPEGFFSIELPENTYNLQIERGKEYLPVQDKITLPASGRMERTYRLQRWVS